MRKAWFSGAACLGLLVAAGPARAQQLWPLHVGPSLDVIDNSFADFDRFRRELPKPPEAPVVPLRAGTPATPYTPVWTPPPPPRIRRAAVSRPAPRAIAQAAPAPTPAPVAAPAAAPPTAPAEQPARRPDLDSVEQRLTERERILRDLQRQLEEERRLVNEWRSTQRAAR